MSTFSERLESVVLDLRNQGYDEYECECGEASDREWDNIAALVNHAMFDHVTRRDIVGINRPIVLGAMVAGLRLDLPATTEYEQRWRDSLNELAP